MDPAILKPLLVTKWSEEMTVPVTLCDILDSWIRQVIVMVVGYHHRVNDRYIFNLAGYCDVALRSQA